MMSAMNKRMETEMTKMTLTEMKRELARLQAELARLETPKMIKVRSLMSGQELEIPEGTPRCCDPSSDLYWSM